MDWHFGLVDSVSTKMESTVPAAERKCDEKKSEKKVANSKDSCERS